MTTGKQRLFTVRNSGFEQDMNALTMNSLEEPDRKPPAGADSSKPKKEPKPQPKVEPRIEPKEVAREPVAEEAPVAAPEPTSAAHAARLAQIRQMLAFKQAQQDRMAAEMAEQERRQKEEAEKKIAEEAAIQAELERRREEKRLEKEELAKQGKLLSKKQKERLAFDQMRISQLRSATQANHVPNHQPRERRPDKPAAAPPEKQAEKKQAEKKPAVAASWDDCLTTSEEESEDEESPPPSAAEPSEQFPKDGTLRSPICCILGHVDTGKTKLLDKIRQTNVQEGEAGGITQQIGATYFPIEAIKKRTGLLAESQSLEVNVPGLLIIDTPGHESFTNLRSRGSSLCNIAILVIDITAGLEAQTLESLNLLKSRKTPFLVALNKVDRIYDWVPQPNAPIRDTLAKQGSAVRAEFEERLSKIKLALAEQGMNAEIYYKNRDFRKNLAIVPTSAVTGEGVPDLLMLIIQLTQKMMSDDLRYVSGLLECTVLEVKVVEGLGTTVDCVLSNGVLREGDRIAICGLNGPIITNVRALLTPQPLREMRVKGQYQHHRMVTAAIGVKISAPDLEGAVAGCRLLRIEPGMSDLAVAEQVMADLATLLNSVDKTEAGVCVQASTLGSLEALLQFLRDMKIPVSGINIGPVHKRDVIRASTIMDRAPEYAAILAFDVKIEREAQDVAAEMGVKIFSADIIYHLFDRFTAYMKDREEQRKKELADQAVFPCALKIVPGCIFNARDPIVMGVNVTEGTLRVGTPLCVIGPDGATVNLGRVISLEVNHKAVPHLRRGTTSVAIRIEPPPGEAPKAFGRHFKESDEVFSRLTRTSIDVLKDHFRGDLDKEDWVLVIRLKKLLGIQ